MTIAGSHISHADLRVPVISFCWSAEEWSRGFPSHTAHGLSRVTELIVLLGGDAGLRCGEMMALEWSDVDLAKRQLCIQRSDWNGEVTSTKGGRLRYIPLTVRLAAALREYRHLRGPRVLCEADGKALTRQIVQAKMKLAAKHANVRNGVHILRHTFCSHLAMRGAPARAIQELAGHSELGLTQRYMHLSPAALDAAIQLLDAPRHVPTAWQHVGNEQVQRGKSARRLPFDSLRSLRAFSLSVARHERTCGLPKANRR